MVHFYLVCFLSDCFCRGLTGPDIPQGIEACRTTLFRRKVAHVLPCPAGHRSDWYCFMSYEIWESFAAEGSLPKHSQVPDPLGNALIYH
jgi:hypothetical protein